MQRVSVHKGLRDEGRLGVDVLDLLRRDVLALEQRRGELSVGDPCARAPLTMDSLKMFFLRSTTRMQPRRSHRPMSPLCSHPSASTASAVLAGSL